jgi:hypothetical protein
MFDYLDYRVEEKKKIDMLYLKVRSTIKKKKKGVMGIYLFIFFSRRGKQILRT